MGAQLGHEVTEQTRAKLRFAASNPSEETRLRMRLAKLGKPSKRLIDLSGRTFGHLTVLCRGENKSLRVGWLCRCSCGEEITVAANALTQGQTHCKRCGDKETAAARTTHGQAHIARKRKPAGPEYTSYMAAKSRCNNPNNIRYKSYGGRGIKFLFTSFEEFFAELGPRPEGTTIDRVDNNGNYEPGNVRWVTDDIQHRSASDAGALGRHNRWHVARNIRKDGCSLCQ